VYRQISQGERIATNITGDRVTPGVLSELIAFRDQFTSNDGTALPTDADAMDTRLDEKLELGSEVDAKMSRVETEQSRLQDESTILQTLVSGEQDVDLTQSIVDLQAREAMPQAALGVARRALKLAPLDFLR
jgi:flagellin-like hook-associated protein FlgL